MTLSVSDDNHQVSWTAFAILAMFGPMNTHSFDKKKWQNGWYPHPLFRIFFCRFWGENITPHTTKSSKYFLKGFLFRFSKGFGQTKLGIWYGVILFSGRIYPMSFQAKQKPAQKFQNVLNFFLLLHPDQWLCPDNDLQGLRSRWWIWSCSGWNSWTTLLLLIYEFVWTGV